MLLRRASAEPATSGRQKSSSPKEDPFHNRATAMNLRRERAGSSASWAPRAGRRPSSTRLAAAKAAVKTDAGLKSGDELLLQARTATG